MNWTNIKGGDTIYVSGGKDSTVYPRDKIQNKIITNGYVTITKGKDVGHNGKVIFGEIASASDHTFGIYSSQGIKLNHLYLYTQDTNSYAATVLELAGGSNNVIDHCTIISNGNGNCVYIHQNENRDIFT